MAPRLVNTAPGDSQDPIKPGQPVHLGFKSDDGEVQLGTARVDIGLSGLLHEGVLPEADTNLSKKGLEVALETSERRRPVVGEMLRTISGTDLVLTKQTNDYGEKSIYEMETRIRKGASLAAKVKITRQSWTLRNPDWIDLDYMGPLHLSLEHGNFNTAANVWLRAYDNIGQLVVGGPASAFNAARPGQTVVTFDWLAHPYGTAIEFLLFFNLVGRPSPFSPAYTPLFELWTRFPNETEFVERVVMPVGTLGEFPNPESSIYTNYRHAPDEIVRLFVGHVGTAGEPLTINSWELYPDWRPSVLQGEPLPDTEFLVLPDGPVSFRSSNGKLPTESLPGRWFKYTGGSAQTPVEKFYFQPGRRTIPLYTSVDKPSSTPRMALQRLEPRLESVDAGFMVEGWVSAVLTEKTGQSLGCGIAVDDGSKSYRVCFLDNAVTRTIGLAMDDGLLGDYSGYYIPMVGPDVQEIDHRSLKFIRLVVDRHRSKVLLFVEDEEFPLLTKNTSDPFPSSPSANGKVYFGHFDIVQSAGKFNVAFLNYLLQYTAWEGEDGVEPDDGTLPAAVQFGEVVNADGDGSTTFEPTDNSVIIKKAGFATPNSYRYFLKEQEFTHEGGVHVDFRMKIDSHEDKGGLQNAPNTDTGVGLRIFFGTKILHLGFYDCGIHGRKIAILPGSGTVTDILTQTALGREFSADINFSEYQNYRLVYRAFDKIEVWAGTVRNKPLLTIPWRSDVDGFDLPLDDIPVQPPAIAFGHWEQYSGSVSRWQYVRWGRSNGYDTAVVQKYSEYPSYLFGGQALVLTDFADTPTGGLDINAPTFAGAQAATALSDTAIKIDWNPAGDNFTPNYDVVYDIYMATMGGGESYASPSFTTAPGATSFIVTGLSPSTTYYFVVRARDNAGNRDSNVIEVSATTQATPTLTFLT